MKKESQSLEFLTVFKKEWYWRLAFASFFLSFFVPAGVGLIRSVFFLMIVLPALFTINFVRLFCLIKTPVFLLVIVFSSFSLSTSFWQDGASVLAKFVLSSSAIVLGATFLSRIDDESVRRLSLVIIGGLICYVLVNAFVYFWRGEFGFGSRVPLLFGQAKSVIFTSNIIVSLLVFYSWVVIKQGRWSEVALVTIVTVSVLMFLLQSRSAFVIWVLSMGCVAMSFGTKNFFKIAIFLLGTLCAVGVILLLTGVSGELISRADSYRLEIWQGYAAATLKCGWLLGCGWGSELGFVTNNGAPIAHPHSMYMQTFYWGGGVGLLLLLTCLGAGLYEGFRYSPNLFWLLLPGCIALGMDGKSLISAPNERWLLVLVPLLFIAAEQMKRQLSSCKALRMNKC